MVNRMCKYECVCVCARFSSGGSTVCVYVDDLLGRIQKNTERTATSQLV